MVRFAVIVDSKIDNVILVDEGSEYIPLPYQTLLNITDQPQLGPGWALVEGVWTPPPVFVEYPPGD